MDSISKEIDIKISLQEELVGLETDNPYAVSPTASNETSTNPSPANLFKTLSGSEDEKGVQRFIVPPPECIGSEHNYFYPKKPDDDLDRPEKSNCILSPPEVTSAGAQVATPAQNQRVSNAESWVEKQLLQLAANKSESEQRRLKPKIRGTHLLSNYKQNPNIPAHQWISDCILLHKINQSASKTSKTNRPASNSALTSKTNQQTSDNFLNVRPKKDLPTLPNNFRGKTLRPQVREVVKNLHRFFNAERNSWNTVIQVDSVQERLSAATGINRETLTAILSKKISDAKKEKGLPKEEKKVAKPVKIEPTAIHHKMATFIVLNRLIGQNKEITISDLTELLKKEANYRYSMDSLWFSFIKSHKYYSCRKKGDKLYVYNDKRIVDLQISYLQQIKKFRQENRPIFYLDDTWFGENRCANSFRKRSWRKVVKTETEEETVETSDQLTAESSLDSSRAAERIFVGHIGNEAGFVQNAQCMFVETTSNRIDATRFEQWFKEDVLPRLRVKSVIVMNNARWHQRRSCVAKDRSKSQILKWLVNNKIEHDSSLPTKELYRQYVLPNKLKYATYVVDAMAERHDCKVVRLPPLHSELNPFSVIWPMIRQNAQNATNCVNFDTQKYFSSIIDEFERFPVDEWKRIVDDIVELENLYYPDLIAGNFSKPMVVLLNDEKETKDSSITISMPVDVKQEENMEIEELNQFLQSYNEEKEGNTNLCYPRNDVATKEEEMDLNEMSLLLQSFN